jgi:hypothetical protein
VIKTLGRLLFVFLGLLLAMVATLLFAWTGLLGSGAEQRLKEASDYALDFYNFHRDIIHTVLAWLGAIGSAVWAAIVFARAWHYADRNLPDRLAEYNRRAAQVIIGQRPEVLAHVEGQRPEDDPKFWNTTNWLRQRRMRNYVAGLDQVSQELDKHITTLDDTRKNCATQRATGHLAAGVSYARQSEELSGQQASTDLAKSLKVRARREYRRAADLDPAAIPYLLKAVDQSIALQQDEEAAADLKRLCAAKLDPRVRATALFRLSEIRDREGAGKDCSAWSEARDHLRAVDEILAQYASDTNTRLERAAARELLGRVQTKRERFTAASTAFNRARELYDGLDPNAVKRVEDAINSIRGEKGDEDN